MLREKPKRARPPLEARDHWDCDFSEFCDQDQIEQYPTIVELIIWLIGPIAAGYLQFNLKNGKSNSKESLDTHWQFAGIWPLLKFLLFWK